MKISFKEKLGITMAIMTLSLSSYATVIYTHTALVGDDDRPFQSNLINSNVGASNGGTVAPPEYITGLDVVSNAGSTTGKSGVTLNTETGFLRLNLQSQIDPFENIPQVFLNINGLFFERLQAVGSGTVKTKVKVHGEWDVNPGFDVDFQTALTADVRRLENGNSNRVLDLVDSFRLPTGQQPFNGEIKEDLELVFDVQDGDFIDWSYQWTAQLSNSPDPLNSFGNNIFNLGDTIQFGAFELSDGLSLISDDPLFLASAADFSTNPQVPIDAVSAPAAISLFALSLLSIFFRQKYS